MTKSKLFMIGTGFIVCGLAALTVQSLSRKPVRVQCQTTKGALELVIMPQWSPQGAERFLQMVDDGFFTGLPLFRCIEGFLCQFGAAPPIGRAGSYPPIADDPPQSELRHFKPGYLSFAGYGPGTRSTHAFIALAAVESLGTQPWETPIGYVSETSMDTTVAHFYKGYGDSPPTGHGPDPRLIEAPDGAQYLHRQFPHLDAFIGCTR